METISERVRQFIDYKRFSIMGFEKKIKVGNNSIGTGIKRKSNLSGDILSKILKKFPEINPEWLLTGKGEMLREPPVPQEAPAQPTEDTVKDKLIALQEEKIARLEAENKAVVKENKALKREEEEYLQKQRAKKAGRVRGSFA